MMSRHSSIALVALTVLAGLSCADATTLPPRFASLSLLEAPVLAAATMPAVRISEIHYDNGGADALEGVEISGPAAQDLTDWTVVPYNGSTGATYTPIVTLGGAIPETCAPRGVVVVPILGLQNGAPDGVALVDAAGTVVEFLSYEGSFAATNGPAAGMTSRDIGASESGSSTTEPASPPEAVKSLQRNSVDAWSMPIANTFGACNDVPPSTTPIARVSIAPAAVTMLAGGTQTFVATAFDADDNVVPGALLGWSSSDPAIASVEGGLALAREPGTVDITATAPSGASASAALTITEPEPLPASPVTISEMHYDNSGTDANEAIEVEGPAGTDLTGWSLALYNGNGGAVYATLALSETLAASCGSRGVTWVSAVGLQNGAPDGIALVNASGQPVEFVSYEGTFRATGGPAAGHTSVDIGVEQNGSAPGLSLQKDALGWYAAPASFGACNPPPAPFVSIFGRTPADPALPVGYEDQLFAELNDGRGGTTPAVFAWSSETPDIATIDADGVVHALAAGTAVLRATADNGATGTIRLPAHVAQPGATASYGDHTGFGVPTDGNPGDDFIIRREQYTSSFNAARGIPNWVSMNLEATHFGPEDRCDCFTFDPALPASVGRYTTADYTGAGDFHGYGIDRGHLARSFDRTAGSLDNATTYLFSNIIPQAADNNQGPWSAMEIAVGDFARFQDREVYIIAGASGSKGTVKNEGRITIPTHVWKVVVVMPRDQGLAQVDGHEDVQVLAVIMPNEPGIRENDWRGYLTTVNAVESLSGYDVLDLLADDIEHVVEAGMQEEVAMIDALAADGKVSAPIANSLRSKLVAAAHALDRGNATAARHQLDALRNEVDALVRSGRLPATDGTALRDAILTLSRTL